MKHFFAAILLSISTLHYFANAAASDVASQDKITNEANDSKINGAKVSEASKYQNTIDEYKKYLLTLDQKTRDEIIRFRKTMIEINKKKKDLYKSLSQEAQLYLEKEKEYKKKLPINQKKQINIQE
jgi:hypothetical protein